MIVDFIKEGSTGQWYMIQIKGFDIAPESQDYILMWNYNRLLRIKNDEEVDEDFVDCNGKVSNKAGKVDLEVDLDNKNRDNKDNSGNRDGGDNKDGQEMRLTSANKLLKNVNSNRNSNRNMNRNGSLGGVKLDTHQQLLFAAMNTTSKDRIAKLMHERGTKCKCCGLYYMNDQFVTVLSTSSNNNKNDHWEYQTGTGTTTGTTTGAEEATRPVRLESKQVPAFGYHLTMSMAYKLFQLYRDHIIVTSRNYYDTVQGKGDSGIGTGMNGPGEGFNPNTHTKPDTNTNTTRRVLKLTKFARDVLSHFEGEKSDGKPIWMPNMYDSIICCYYCNQVVDEYNKYVTTLQVFNHALGVPINKVLSSVSCNTGTSSGTGTGTGGEREYRVRDNDRGVTFDGELSQGKTVTATNNRDNVVNVDVHQYLDEVNTSIKKRRQFLIQWFHLKYQLDTGETGPAVGLSVALAYKNNTIDLPAENEIEYPGNPYNS